MKTEQTKKIISMLKSQDVNPYLIDEVILFREKYFEADDERITEPSYIYYGKDIWEMAISAIVCRENILLSGPKATGKNVLADNLAYIFGRPSYNMSFHINTDSASLIGTDTFVDNQVTLRKGPVYLCASEGAFGIFDEINMAKNDAVSVLHSSLDHRRIIDIPGYERIKLSDATRFIGTMNYGYAGTKELNEALVSRFLVIDMPAADEQTLRKILNDSFSSLTEEALSQFSGLFLDLQMKALNGEISTKPVDLRGLISAIRTIRIGLSPSLAVMMGLTNKSFDLFERDIIGDVVMTRIPPEWSASNVFK